MRVTIATRGMPHQRAWGERLASGLRAAGDEPVAIDANAKADTEVVACWGWRVGKEYREKGHEVLVAERGYIGDRFVYTSLGWNGLNGRARFPFGSKRCDFGVEMRPWRRPSWGPLTVLLLGQVRGDAALFGVDYAAWLSRAVANLRDAGHRVVFRPHPKDDGLRVGTETAVGTLQECFARVDAAMTFNSNSATDAVVAGVPCWTADEGAMTWGVTSRPGDDLIMPDRSDWLAGMSWAQWADDEIESGEAWEAVRTCL